MKKMRIVAKNYSYVFVQKNYSGCKWVQERMRNSDFENLMKADFPKYYEVYKNSDTDCDVADFFYHYGESERMIAKGEAYTFIA